MGTGLRTLCILGKHSSTETDPQPICFFNFGVVGSTYQFSLQVKPSTKVCMLLKDTSLTGRAHLSSPVNTKRVLHREKQRLWRVQIWICSEGSYEPGGEMGVRVGFLRKNKAEGWEGGSFGQSEEPCSLFWKSRKMEGCYMLIHSFIEAKYSCIFHCGHSIR